MSNRTHCAIRYFDAEGDLVGEGSTVEAGCIPGVARTLNVGDVIAVELHYEDGTSEEHRFLPDT